MKPIGNKILVEAIKPPEKTTGGIVMPASSKETTQRGTVIAVGPGRMLDSGQRAAPSVETGHVVIYAPWAGADIEIQGNKFKVLTEDDLYGVE